MEDLVVEHLNYTYAKNLKTKVLHEVSFKAHKGEYVFVLGPNGVGKSTLFRCLTGHLKPLEGKIQIEGKAIQLYSKKEWAKKVAYIPQVEQQTFNYSVLEIAMMGRNPHLSIFTKPSKQDEQIVRQILKKLGLEEKASCGICEISGGERQLTMIARALAQEAQILIMDEPTSHLDYGNQIRVQHQMQQLTREGYLIIQACHNPQYALLFGDKVVAMQQGKVIACGVPTEIITSKLIKALYHVEVVIHNGAILPQIIE